jgi:hypothetical protein
MPVKQPVGMLDPAPTIAPTPRPARDEPAITRLWRAFPEKLYEVHQRAALVSMSPDLPLQTIGATTEWCPGPPTSPLREPILVRNFNELPRITTGSD